MFSLSPNVYLILTSTLALGAFGAGLSALNLNLLSVLKLNAISLLLKYVCGVAGLYGGYIFVTNYAEVAAYGNFAIAISIILITANIGIGISGLGTNILRALHMEYLQKSLQLIAGAAGIYTIITLIQAQ